MSRRRQRPRAGPRRAGGGREGAGEEFEVEVERILPGGVGLAHAGGRTVFVALAAPVEPPEEIHITPSPLEWRYRSRARWQHDPVRNFLGYYERGSHRVCDVA